MLTRKNLILTKIQADIFLTRNKLILTQQLPREWFGDFPACFLHFGSLQKSKFKTFTETYDGEMEQGDPDGDFFWGVFHSLPGVACCILHLQPVKISNFLTKIYLPGAGQ